VPELPLAAAQRRLGKSGRPRKPALYQPLQVSACVPRLLNLDAAAVYLGVSPWTVRDLDGAGVLPRVRVPLPHGGELRRLLFDREDLDRLIESWKDAGPSRGGTR
jgi:hypothetical protein